MAVSMLVTAVLVAIVLRALYKAYATPLRDIPGPPIAKFTRFWLCNAINSRKYHEININIHRKYGPIVRISPNEYSIDDLEASKIIYRSHQQLVKAPRYLSWGLPNAESNIFSSVDIEHNASRRRQISTLYQMGALTNIQYQVDNTSTIFMQKLADFADQGKIIDMAQWLQYYAFDAVSCLTFDQPVGFLEKGIDVADIIATIHTYARYGAVMGVFGEWHPFVFRILQLMAPKGEVGIAYIYSFTAKAIAQWNSRSDKEHALDEENTEGGALLQTDYLGSLLAKHRRDSQQFKVDDASYHVLSNVVAGGETTGISLAAAIHFLIQYPHVLEKLRRELDGLDKSWNERVSMKDAQNCCYLQAFIKEVLRMYPATGLNLPRVVPKGGLELVGRFFPEGTIVGVNSWVAHANRSIFGPDADSFRPERWLEAQAVVNQMEQYFFTFGRGPRVCVGKSLALMGMNKIIPEIVLHFDVALADPQHDWTVHDDWFVLQEDFQVKLRKRRNGGGSLRQKV